MNFSTFWSLGGDCATYLCLSWLMAFEAAILLISFRSEIYSMLVYVVTRHYKHLLLQQAGESEPRSVLMGVGWIEGDLGWCGIQGRSSLIGLNESWDCCWGEAEVWRECLVCLGREGPSFKAEGERGWDPTSGCKTLKNSIGCSCLAIRLELQK